MREALQRYAHASHHEHCAGWIQHKLIVDRSVQRAALSALAAAAAAYLAATAEEPSGVVPWRCFHCDDMFTDEHAARLHFGPDEGSQPACKIKAGAEGGLLGALRRAEADAGAAWKAIHEETTDAARAHYAQQDRHATQLRLVEEAGYERGLADGMALRESPAPPAEAAAVATGGALAPFAGCFMCGREDVPLTDGTCSDCASKAEAAARCGPWTDEALTAPLTPPFRVERDWTWEVVDSSPQPVCVAKYQYHEAAERTAAVLTRIAAPGVAPPAEASAPDWRALAVQLRDQLRDAVKETQALGRAVWRPGWRDALLAADNAIGCCPDEVAGRRAPVAGEEDRDAAEATCAALAAEKAELLRFLEKAPEAARQMAEGRVERAVQQAVLVERERCANVAAHWPRPTANRYADLPLDIAAAIRKPPRKPRAAAAEHGLGAKPD